MERHPQQEGHPRLHGKLKGFTFVEVLLVIILVSLLAGVTVPMVRDSANATKYEGTREKMEKIREAILGTESVDNSGRRNQFGYVGDWGSLPVSLSSLVTAQTPAWSLSTAQAIGAGWRGPYLEDGYVGPEGITKDKWGFTFAYNPAASPPTLTSYGADNKAGGSVFDKDLVMELSTTAWKGQLYGFVMDHNVAQSGKTVQLQYPATGALTQQTSTTDANGAFSFTQVPYGLRSVTVTGAPTLGPRQFVMEAPYQVISGGLLNYFARSQRVSYVAGSFSAAGSGGTVTIRLNNSYSTAKTIDFITSWFDRQGTTTEAFLRRVALGTTAQLIAGVGSNTRVDITTAMILPANSTNNTFQLSFTTTAGGNTAQNMSTTQFSDRFEWVNGTDQDVVSFP